MSKLDKTCSCGLRDLHILASRLSLDGVYVTLWSDGSITGRLGVYPRGLGTPRGDLQKNLSVGWKVLDSACIYNFSEIATLVKKTRKQIQA